MRREAMNSRHEVVATIRGYHGGSFGGFKYFASDRAKELDEVECAKGYGLEIETQCWGLASNEAYATVLEKIIFPAFHVTDRLFKAEEDATLRGGRSRMYAENTNTSYAELVSQVMTKAFIRNHYRDFKAMFGYFDMFDISAVKTGHCGMHVNISVGNFGSTEEKQTEAIRKFYYIVNHHYEAMRSAVRRTGSTQWCAQMRCEKEYVKNMDLRYMSGSHGNCINGSHIYEGRASRVELRLVGGQGSYPEFRNTMETVFQLVEASKRLNWSELDDIVNIFDGCNNHVFSRVRLMRDEDKITTDDVNRISTTVKSVDWA